MPRAEDSSSSRLLDELIFSRSTIDKSLLAELVLESLVVDGHSGAAVSFSEEAGLDAPSTMSSMEGRVAIRHAILHRRDALAAVQGLRELQPSLLASHPELLFRLHQQHVMNLLSDGEPAAAWEHAATSLVSLADASGDAELQRAVDATAVLFSFCDLRAAAPALPPASAALLTPEYRAETARMMNVALLAAEGGVTVARLPMLLNVLAGILARGDGRLGEHEVKLQQPLHSARSE